MVLMVSLLVLRFGYCAWLASGQKGHAEAEDAIAHIVARTKAAGKKSGIFASGGAQGQRRKSEGIDLVVPTAGLFIREMVAGELAIYHS